MSFLLFAAAASVLAAGAGFLAARRGGRGDAKPPSAGQPDAVAEDPRLAALSRLPVSLGDVISVEADDRWHRTGAKTAFVERWLEGGVAVFDGTELVAALFVAPEGGTQEGVVAFAPPRRDIGWVSRASVDVGAEAPATIEIDGVVLSRKRRLSGTLLRVGKGAPRLGDAGMFVEYEASGAMIAVVVKGEQTTAWLGKRYEQGSYDRMGSGGA